MSDTALAPAWIPAPGGYSLALIGSKLACRNAKGTVLKSVPKAAKESETAAELIALRDFLARHEAQCRAQVESWMTGSLAVPAALLAATWPDESWSRLLRNLVVIAGPERGLLRGTSEDGRIGIVDLDGETRWLDATTIQVPHPIDIPDLAGFQELLAELGEEQAVAQLTRLTFAKPSGLGDEVTRISAYQNGEFAELRHATSRAAANGYPVRGGFVCCPVLDQGRSLQARYWIGSDAPDAPAWTGELLWVDQDERAVPVATLGAVAYSEGVRMAETIYAGRKVAADGQE